MTPDELKKHAVELANANQALMDGTMEPIQKLLDENDVVFAVWQDHNATNGVDMLIVKGQQTLREVMASDQGLPAKMTAISCIEEAQAIALCDRLGEHDRRH